MADHVETLLDAARDGSGIARLPYWPVAEDIAARSLRSVLDAESPLVIDTYLVRAATRVPSIRITVAADYLAGAIARSMQA